MVREWALKVVLVVVELLFVATAYPLVAMRLDESLQMMLSLYITLGIFLLLAARNPSAYRSVIAFAAWSSVAHAAVMTVQGFYDVAERVFPGRLSDLRADRPSPARRLSLEVKGCRSLMPAACPTVGGASYWVSDGMKTLPHSEADRCRLLAVAS